MEIWHNPRCSHSRQTKDRLDQAGVAYTERRYLENPPTVAELSAAVEALGIAPRQLVRTGDARKLGLDLVALGEDRSAWLQLMADNPSIIQRPVVIADDGRAVIGRPPQDVDSILP